MTGQHTLHAYGVERLRHALDGVELSETDRTIIDWLAGWGPEVVDPIASLVERTALAHGVHRVPAQRGEAESVRAAYDARRGGAR